MLQAIQTLYHGYKFRSRLEARWAVFFDALSIAWEYEKEGYNLNGTWYLPDFWIPSLDSFIEIKGEPINADDEKKICLLADISGKTIALFEGAIPFPHPEFGETESGCIYHSSEPRDYVGWADNHYWWCLCTKCNKIGLAFEGRSERLCRCHPDGNKLYTYDHPRIVTAYTAARQARFEHGETP